MVRWSWRSEGRGARSSTGDCEDGEGGKAAGDERPKSSPPEAPFDNYVMRREGSSQLEMGRSKRYFTNLNAMSDGPISRVSRRLACDIRP